MPLSFTAPTLPKFVPAYSAEFWDSLGRQSEHEDVIVVDSYDGLFFGEGQMAVLLSTDCRTGARYVADLAIADDDHNAVTNLLSCY